MSKKKPSEKKAPEKTVRYKFSDLDRESVSSRDIRIAQEERRKRRLAENEKSAASKARHRAARRRRRIVIAVFLLVGLAVFASVGRSIVNLVELQAEKSETEAKLAQLQRQKGSLEEELQLVNTDEYVEQQARSELKMVKPGEILFLMTGEGTTEYTEKEPEETTEEPAESGKPTND